MPSLLLQIALIATTICYVAAEVTKFPGCHTGITDLDMMALEVVNEERVLKDKKELDVNAELQAVAFYQAQDIENNVQIRSCPTKYAWTKNSPAGVTWSPCKCNVESKPFENDCFMTKLEEIFPDSTFGPVFIAIAQAKEPIKSRDDIRAAFDANKQNFIPVVEGTGYKTTRMTQYGAAVQGKTFVAVVGASASHEPCLPMGRSLNVNQQECETYCGEYENQVF